jgi:hypothetical protein
MQAMFLLFITPSPRTFPHLVFDDQFMSITCNANDIPETFFQNLFNKASWTYALNTDAELEDFYSFDDYWGHPPLSKNKRSISSSSLPDRRTTALVSLCISYPEPTNSSFAQHDQFPPIKVVAFSTLPINSPTTTLSIKCLKTAENIVNVKLEHKNMQSTPIKLNLVPIPTQNASFTAWKAQQCIHAQVHHVMNPTAIQSHLQDIRDDLSCAPSKSFVTCSYCRGSCH